MLDEIAALAPERRRVATVHNLFGERVAHVFFDKPGPRLLVVENVELGAQFRFSEGGVPRRHQFDQDAGPAFQTYVVFLEDNIVGIVRPDRGPHAKQICTVLTVLTGYGIALEPLIDPKVERRLSDRKGSEVSRMKFSAVRGRAARLKKTTRLGRVFEVAEEVFPNASTFSLSVTVEEEKERGRFWGSSKRNIIDPLLNDEEALEQLEEAEVGFTAGRAVHLVEDRIIWKGSVPTDVNRDLDEKMMLTKIQEAYAEERSAIFAALGRNAR